MKPRKDDKPYAAPLCYICNKRRSTRRDRCCDACRVSVKANGGRLFGHFSQPGYSPDPAPMPYQMELWHFPDGEG